jgi:ATP-binding cassette subfamily B (MDR/TAP) protein 1
MPVVEEIEHEKRPGLSEDDTALLDVQVHIPPSSAGYKTIYRYAERVDVVVMAVSSIAAVGAGTCLPLMTVGPKTKPS